MLLALAINTEQSIDSFLFYLIQYIITNLNIFFILLAISYICIKYRQEVTESSSEAKAGGIIEGIADMTYIRDLQGLFYVNPFLSLTLSLSLFSMAGIPPFVGFFSKQFVLYSALDSGYYFLSFLGILVSVISASYYLKLIKMSHIEAGESSMLYCLLQNQNNSSKSVIANESKQEPTQDCSAEEDYVYLSQFHSFIISILSLFILLFILKPALILNSTQVLSLTLFKL